MAKDKVAVPDSGHFHAVRSYQDAASLAKIVAAFMAEGLVTAQPAIIIATPEHRHAITRQLLAMSFNLDQLNDQRHLFVLDANETLATFMVDAMPSAERFEEVMIPLIGTASNGRKDCRIRAYGEMVEVLWKDGKEAAALRLEILWNQLANTRKFSLLCGYSMGSSTRARRSRTSVSSTHTGSLPEAPQRRCSPSTARVTPVH